MSLFDSIKPLIRICQTFGLTPFSLNQNTQKWVPNPSLKALSITLIIYDGIILLFMVAFRNVFLKKSSELINILFHFLLLFNHIHAIFALVELFLKCHHQIELLNKFMDLEILLTQHLNAQINCKKFRKKCLQIICIWFGEVFGIFIIDLLSYLNSKDTKQLIYLWLFIPSYALGELSYAYSVLLVTLANEYLVVMNQYLIWMNKPNGYYISKENYLNSTWNSLIVGKTEIDIEKLYFIRRSYWRLWEATETMKYLTFWSLHVGISNESFVLTLNSFFLISSIFFVRGAFIDYILLSILITNNLVNLLFICHHSSNVDEIVSGEKISNIFKDFLGNSEPNSELGHSFIEM